MSIRRVCLSYLALGLLLTPVPLLNVLQAESAAVVALVAFFVSGFSALAAFDSSPGSIGHVLTRQEAALLIPLGVLTVARLWAPNCTYLQGLLFYVLFPGVTVVFAVALAYALRGMNLSRPGLVLGATGIIIGVGGPLYDLGLHPQFYTYNHVFGGVLGPIYDEQLAVRPGLFAFRGLTLLWAVAALLVGRRLRGLGPRWMLPACALAIGTVYLFSAPLGLNTPAWYIQDQLGGHTRTAHFDLYYDPDRLSRSAVNALAETHEAKYAWVRRRLHVEPTRQGKRIQSYAYPNPDVKGKLTGARTTSVSPVWLARPQIHLLRDRVASSLGHELAHVVSRPYGLPLLRASWAAGLIEGWAVALEPPSPTPSPDDLVVTATTADTTAGLRTEANAVASRLSPWGFWTGRGAVSYATMGSFVQYLLDRYGPEKLKRVYAWGNFKAVYGRSLRSLATGWAAHLERRPGVARGAHALVSRQFARPSLFETDCPHYVPPPRRHLQAAQRARRRRDTTRMLAHLREALATRPRFAAAHQMLARIRLARGQAATVRRQIDTLATKVRTVGLRVALADARALVGAADAAQSLYTEALAHVPHYAPETRVRLMLRDAVADRPAAVRILVSGDSAHVQARRLAKGEAQSDAVRVWRGVRFMDGHRYASALEVWQRTATPMGPDRPSGWTRAWTLQRKAWGAEAALHTGSTTVAHRWAGQAARRARTLGDGDRAALFDWWATRARARQTGRAATTDGVPASSSDPSGPLGPLPSSIAANHVPGLSVEPSVKSGRPLGSTSSQCVFVLYGSRK